MLRAVAALAGGIITQADLTIVNSTISGNTLRREVWHLGCCGASTASGTLTLSLTYVTISNNLNTIDSNYPTGESISVDVISSTTVVDSVDSIFDASGGETVYLGPAAAFHSLGHNLFSDTPGFAVNATDQTNSNPLLGPLANHGGPTLTQALLPEARLAAGVPITGVTSDQRGVARPSSGPDIGAYECSCLRPSSASSGTASIINARASS